MSISLALYLLEILEHLSQDSNLPDIERIHYLADCIMERLIRKLGYSDISDTFCRIYKWYA